MSQVLMFQQNMKFSSRESVLKKSRYTNVTTKNFFLGTYWRKNSENSLFLGHVCFLGPSSIPKAWKLLMKHILFINYT